MRSHGATIRSRAFVATVLYLVLGAAQAQLPYIAPELYQEQRRLQGEKITFCIWESNPTSEFDQAVAEAVADALLLEPGFHRYEPPYVMEEGPFFQAVLVLLTEHCDAIAGFNLVADGYPDWLITSRAYYSAPFVFVSANEDYERLGDVPPGSVVGSRLFTPADQQLNTYLRSMPESERWRRFPYTESPPMLRHVREGVIEAGLLWLPQFLELSEGTSEGTELSVLAPDPLPEVHRSLTFVMRQDDAYLRSLLDAAIESLIADGVIEQLMEEHGLPGMAGSPN